MRVGTDLACVPFILLDLRSQASFIPCAVRAWPRQGILAWLCQYGDVQEWPIVVGEETQVVSQFRAPTGLTTIFLLQRDGKLSIFEGEHTMRTVWG